MNKKIEIPLRQYLESDIYLTLKISLNEELNNNSQMINIKPGNQKFRTNLVEKYDFKKSTMDKLHCKNMKKSYKKHINSDISHKLKSEIINIIAKSEPNWNVSLTILS